MPSPDDATHAALLDTETTDSDHSSDTPRKGLPLYIRIIIALALGVMVGIAGNLTEPRYVAWMGEPAKLILRLLGALAPPLVLVAVVNALIHADIRGPLARKLAGLLVLNTVVAIVIGLIVANVIQPGRHGQLTPPAPKLPASASIQDPDERRIVEAVEKAGFQPADAQKTDPLTQFMENVPRSLVGPLTDDGSVLSVILIAIGFGAALRPMRDRSVRTIADAVGVALDALITLLHWIVNVIPFGVFGIVASIIARSGFQPFIGLALFIVTVLTALLLQACWYLTRIRLGTWVRPGRLLKGCRDAMVMAFSTDSSTATMPVTYECLHARVGLRTRSASLGALVGSNFNNDGTALYEAVSALFISQAIGRNLDLRQQLMVVLTSIAASVGAAGIPEAGLVTMTLVFRSVGLPTEYIALLLTVDWFLDRCRTVINVMGDMNVSCMLDGKTPEVSTER